MSEIVSAVTSIATKAAPILGPIGTAVSLGTGVYSIINSRRQNKASNAAAASQQASINAQTAVQNRATIAAQNQAATLDLQSANQARSAAANRRSRGGLQYAGPTSLKTTLGG